MTVEASVTPRKAIDLRSLWHSVFRRKMLIMTLLDQAAVSGFSFVVGIATARVVGIEEFGRFALALAFAAFVQVFHDALFAAPMISLAGRRERRSRAYYAAVNLMAAIVAVAGGVAAGGSLVLVFAFRDGALPWALAAATAFLTAAQCAQLTIRRTAFAQGRGSGAFAMDLARGVVFALVLVVVLLGFRHTVGASEVVAMLAFSSLVVTVGLSATLRLGPVTRRVLRTTSGVHWAVARWLMATPAATISQDVILWTAAGIMFGDSAVGGFRAAQYMFGPILALAAAMENLIPLRATAALTSGGVSDLRRYLLRIAVPLGLANAALILVFAVPASFWLNLVFGSAYADYGVVTQVLAFSIAASLVRTQVNLYFRAVQRTQPIFVAAAIGVVATLASLVPATHVFGLVGIALSMAIGQSVWLVGVAIAAVRHYRRSV